MSKLERLSGAAPAPLHPRLLEMLAATLASERARLEAEIASLALVETMARHQIQGTTPTIQDERSPEGEAYQRARRWYYHARQVLEDDQVHAGEAPVRDARDEVLPEGDCPDCVQGGGWVGCDGMYDGNLECQDGRVSCDECHGLGHDMHDIHDPCSWCEGEGEHECETCRGKGFVPCATCCPSGAAEPAEETC
jgi:hypothetical protein